MILPRIILLAFAVSLAGCAIRPLPQDFAGVSTPVIVKQIRCETRQAIIDLALGWLTAPENQENHRVDPRAQAIGFEFQQGKRPIQQFDPKLFQGHVKEVVDTFYDAGVAYTFDLEMTETNNLDTEINLLKPFKSSNLTLGIKGGADRSRKNERIFTLTDTFGGLLKLPDHYCSGASIGRNYNHLVPANYIYPITGNIGVKGFVAEFVNMTIYDHLGGPKDKPDGPPTLVDALEFQTVVSGTLAPKITFTGGLPGVADATLTGEASRTDLHKVTMGLAIAGKEAKNLAVVRAFPAFALISTHSTTFAEARAAEAVNQALTLNLFKPNVIIKQ